MRLKRFTRAREWVVFEVLTASGWVSGFSGRLTPVDRFLSNFNKPLRRRMLFTDPNTPLPDSNVFRDPLSGEIFIAGQSRYDNDGDELYQRVTVCHSVTGDSADLLPLRRKAPVGPIGDPGWLVESVIAEVYGDFELRATAEADGANNETFGLYFLHLPMGTGAKAYDFITFKGQPYRIDAVYYDSGFEVARVSQRKDDRQDLVFKLAALPTYNRQTGEVESQGETLANVTATVKAYSDVRDTKEVDSAGTLTVFVDEANIGFEPKTGMKLEYYGTHYECKRVVRDSETSQWVLRFE